MPKYAPIAGIDVMEELHYRGIAGDYHLWLAHDVLKDPARWKKLACSIHNTYPNALIIMDNSLIELGHSIPYKDLLNATLIAEADTLVLPDKLGDAEATMDMSMEAYRALMAIPGVEHSALKFLGVVQGRDRAQMLWCANFFSKLDRVKMLSVPRVTVELLGSRFYITEEIFDSFHMSIHLLGFSDNIPDDVATCQLEGVLGIDSAVPIRMGLQRWKIGWKRELPPRSPDYLSYSPTTVTDRVVGNIETFRRWIL